MVAVSVEVGSVEHKYHAAFGGCRGGAQCGVQERGVLDNEGVGQQVRYRRGFVALVKIEFQGLSTHEMGVFPVANRTTTMLRIVPSVRATPPSAAVVKVAPRQDTAKGIASASFGHQALYRMTLSSKRTVKPCPPLVADSQFRVIDLAPSARFMLLVFLQVRDRLMLGEEAEMAALEFDDGRFFSRSEYMAGTNKVILGYEIANELFREKTAVGKYVKMYGQKFLVIGVLKKEGDNLFSVIPFDEATMISYNTARKFINVKDKFKVSRLLSVRTKPGVTVDELKDEVTGILRAHRRLKPTEDNNFALNEISLLNQVLDKFFSVMNFTGILIGSFALVVGMFSVANIMFVSVKERTSIIGIKKALGANNLIILFEFLIESIILCIIGGAVGLLFVLGIMKLITSSFDFYMFLSVENVIWGLIWSVIVGILSGLIPAFIAARMDPVEAIRR